MNTPYGEVKSIEDLFIVVETITNRPGTGGFGSVIEEIVECKMCGDKIRGISTKGAWHSEMTTVEQKMEKHLELHRLIQGLTTVK